MQCGTCCSASRDRCRLHTALLGRTWRDNGHKALCPLSSQDGVSLLFIILIASLTGLPAHLSRAARVSRVCQVFPPGKPLDRFAAWLCQTALSHPPHTVVWLWGSPTPTLISASRACLCAAQACPPPHLEGSTAKGYGYAWWSFSTYCDDIDVQSFPKNAPIGM